MKKSLSILLACLVWLAGLAQPRGSTYFEMRTYHCHEGKRPDLIKRFMEHTLRLFEKHHIENVAYFLPVEENNNTLTFILGYPDQQARDIFWNNFANDAEWQRALEKSELNGALVAKVDQVFLRLAPELSSGISNLQADPNRIFELRTYFMHPGRVDAITARFRDHTRALFEKHGMTNVVYFYTVEKNDAQPKLVYLLAHPSVEAAKESFNKFREDSDWKKARDDSEVSGPIVIKVESVYLRALPFSPMK